MRQILFVFFIFSINVCYSSFPISNDINPYELNIIESDAVHPERNINATISFISGILWFPSLVLAIGGALASAASFSAVMILLTIAFVLMSIIFGILGLRKKRRRLLAIIGLASGLFCLLLFVI